MERATIRKQLFRLIMLLKLAMWTVIAIVLAIGISDIARGREAGPPMALIWAIPVLIAAQIAALAAWRWAGRQQ